ncbi:hypothetical protein F5050DRAFT_1713273 [Lentinula boryana]|uniref:Tyrosinase copper-binding domain-containing protein n=1 Tax=Lentinula boryana TaxID=40481 RepID=A0ABQ8Q8W6_9AGAR|nr:hypothetical protein F5050DRAFT_1713273 [Lentinula boryana]
MCSSSGSRYAASTLSERLLHRNISDSSMEPSCNYPPRDCDQGSNFKHMFWSELATSPPISGSKVVQKTINGFIHLFSAMPTAYAEFDDIIFPIHYVWYSSSADSLRLQDLKAIAPLPPSQPCRRSDFNCRTGKPYYAWTQAVGISTSGDNDGGNFVGDELLELI